MGGPVQGQSCDFCPNSSGGRTANRRKALARRPHFSYSLAVPASEKVQRLAESYSALSNAERQEFVSLVAPSDDHEVSSEWNEELLRRTHEIDEGKVQLIDGDDFLSRLRAA